ncbi:MAG: putative Ig domain-containing protein, partial [Anaerolineales bacterium]
GLPTGLEIDPMSGIISGTISYTASISSPFAITITVEDDYASPASTEIGFAWAITDTNRSPIVTNPGNQQNIEAELVDLQIQADDPEGDPLSYVASGLPDGLAIDPQTGLIHGRLSAQSAGHHSVQVVVSDGDASQDASIDFIWVVFDRYFLPLLSKQQ